MNRSSSRGSPAGRGSHVYQLNEEPSVHSPANGKVTDDWKSQSNAASFSGGRSLTISPSMQDHLSPSRTPVRNGDMANGNGSHRPDYLSSPDTLKPCLENLPSARGKKGYAAPLGTTMVLCFVSAFLVLGMLGSRSRAYNLRLVPTLGIYRSHRRLQAEVVVDPFRGGIFGHGSVRMKELPSCDSSFEDYVPCYEQDAESLAEFNQERHCETSNRREQCLIPPPEEYRLPPRWPESRKGAWHANMKFVEQLGLSGRRLARLKLEADEFASLDLGTAHFDGLDNHVQQVLKAVFADAGNKSELGAILDINCALSRLRELHNTLEESSILCLAPYEVNGSQVQYALERGYPAFIGSLSNTQLPLPSSAFDMIHVLDSDLDWTGKDGLILLELDRLLKPGGYFVQVMLPSESFPDGHKQDCQINKDMASTICWSIVLETPQTLMWRKGANQSCYSSRGLEAKPKQCGKFVDLNKAWYPPLRPCITMSSVEKSTQLSTQRQYVGAVVGFLNEEVSDDSSVWAAMVKSYWSLLTPIIFSDHPKRPGEEDPPPPSNIVRNILDMNALYGSLNSALLDAKKSVWVMNVVPRSGLDTLPLIYKRGLIGLQHDWCEAFPTYPRSFDLLHGIGLLSQELGRSDGCALSTLFLEMDRLLRPEGWVILRDRVELIEDARIAAGQMRWETRVIKLEGLEDQQLLVCQKTFWRNPSSKAVLL
ncbi:hypothetical protein L7F22_022205 [Adiantum nelumboides]|nr:hypothetical protein [Adiantum nelumboides]